MDNSAKQLVFVRNHSLFSIPLENVIEVSDFVPCNPMNTLGNGLVGIVEYQSIPIPVFDPDKILEVHSRKPIPLPSDTNVADNNLSNDFSLLTPNESLRSNLSYVIVSESGWRMAILQNHFYKIIPAFRELQSPPEDFQVGESEDIHGEKSLISSIGLLDKKTLYVLDIAHCIRTLRRKLGSQITDPRNRKIAADIPELKEVESISKYLCFFIQDIQLGIPIQDVMEVVDNHLVTPLFKVNYYLRGLINVRGKIYPCIDISNHLKLPYRALNENTKFIILGYNHKEIAICCDRISNMKDLSNKIIQNNEGLFEKNLNQLSFGIANIQNETVLIMSSRAIIEAEELEAYKKDKS